MSFNLDFFMETFMLGAWLIWKQRNNTVFNRGTTTFQGWRFGFIEEAMVQANRMKHGKQTAFISLVNLYKYLFILRSCFLDPLAPPCVQCSFSSDIYNTSSATLSRRYLRFPLISAINFYYVINKLIILILDLH
jgi:hypothetical protein